MGEAILLRDQCTQFGECVVRICLSLQTVQTLLPQAVGNFRVCYCLIVILVKQMEHSKHSQLR